MKKPFLFTMLACHSIISFAQTNYGIKASLNLANQSLHVSGNGESVSRSGSGIVSFQVGGFADIPLSESVHVNPELLLSGEGANFDEDVTGETLHPRLYYLRIPVNLNYEMAVPGDVKFFIGAGPEFGYGLFGKTTVASESTNSFQDSLFNRFDFGLNFISGVQLSSGFRITVNYYLGLSSIATSTFTTLVLGSSQGVDSFKWRNRVLSLSVGLALNTNRLK